MLRVGIDIGGTFTDFVVQDLESDRIDTFKISSDSNNPAATVVQGLERIGAGQVHQIIHGSTVATNALLERKGARTALVTTRGFKDVLQIARQNRPSLYDWNVMPAPPLVPAELRFELDERVDRLGNVLIALDPSQVEGLASRLVENGIESVAICFLFSFLFPFHEQMVADQLRQAGFSVSASSEILPEFREFERTSTTVVNAYVSPIMNHYLSDLETALPVSSLQIMQSNGGMVGVNEASRNGALCILSGPAGGIIGAQNIAQAILDENSAEFPGTALKLITFDMGGTSTDVSLIDGHPRLTTETSVGGCPIHLPLLDIHTIGAGGGSIATVDAGGALRVGPQSAGANPGPACYGFGQQPTVTDANLVLGRLLPNYFLGGAMKIYPDRSLQALENLGVSLNMPAVQVARGMIEVVNSQMEHALRVISVERGYDPREFSLFAFGGAAGLHAVELARRMGIRKVIISKFASTLSAFGMLATNVIKDYVKTVMMPATVHFRTLSSAFSPLVSQGKKEIAAEGIGAEDIEVDYSVDARFAGQSYELNVPFSAQWLQDFHAIHTSTYGYTYTDRPVEIVNLRVRVIGKISPAHLPKSGLPNQGVSSPKSFSTVELQQGAVNLPVYDYGQLVPGSRFSGPALIVSQDTTILVENSSRIFVDAFQNLLIDL